MVRTKAVTSYPKKKDNLFDLCRNRPPTHYAVASTNGSEGDALGKAVSPKVSSSNFFCTVIFPSFQIFSVKLNLTYSFIGNKVTLKFCVEMSFRNCA